MANIFKSKYTGEQIEEILDKANNVTDVQANNGEPTTADLSTLKIGDVNYKIPEPTTPEEPTVVEANPSGDATAELTKLKVGNTIYSIPQNSGGELGGGTKLYQHNLTLSNNYNIIFVSNRDTEYRSVIEIVSPLLLFGGVVKGSATSGYTTLLITFNNFIPITRAIDNANFYGLNSNGALTLLFNWMLGDALDITSDTVTEV